MKPILLLVAASLSVLALAACGERETTHAEKVDSNEHAAKQAEKSFDKENSADPAAMQAAPAPQ